MIEGEFLRVDGVRFYVAQHGGGGKPLLLINGVGAHHAMWSVALEHLGDLSIIMADPPGIGRSPAVPFPLTISDYAGLVAAVVRKLGHEQVDVLGYSFGGAVAQELTRRHSALVRRLVLVGTSCGGGGIPGTAPALATLFTPLRYHSPGFYNATVGWISADGTERDPAIIDHASSLRSLHRPTLMGYAAQLNALMHWSSLRWLHTLRPPTLVVSGDADPLVPPANGALLASMIPEARLRIQPGEGHFLTLDPSSTMWEGVGDFLRSNQHPESSSWQTAIEVDEDDVRSFISKTRGSAQPLATIQAVLRAFLPPLGPQPSSGAPA